MSLETTLARISELQSALAPAAPARSSPPGPPAGAPGSFQVALEQATAGAPVSAAALAPAAAGGGMAWPVQAPVTSPMGPRWGRMHEGIDLGAPHGAPVGAAAAGRVKTAAFEPGGYGNLVVVEHPDGRETRYAHLAGLDVRPGDVVAAGQQIGRVGNTGRSTGPHLHFEVRVDGRAVDPLTILPRR